MNWLAQLIKESILLHLKNRVKFKSSSASNYHYWWRALKGSLEAQIDYLQQSLDRLRYGARLCKQTNPTILLTGGMPDKIYPRYFAEPQVVKILFEKELSISTK